MSTGRPLAAQVHITSVPLAKNSARFCLSAMSERIPAAYPNMGTNQINFSLPLRLAHHRSMSSLSGRSYSSTKDAPDRLDVPHSARSGIVSAPTSPACASVPSSHNHPPTLHPNGHSSNPSFIRRPRPQLHLDDHTRLRAASTSSTSSSLEASLAELEELIEVLSTPAPYVESFFENDPKGEVESSSEARPVGSPRTVPANIRRCAQDGPRWI